MNLKTKWVTLLICIIVGSNYSQTTYTWIGGNSGSFTSAANWSPSRLNGQVSDILKFNSGSTINVSNVQQQTVGQLIISNNTHVILTPASGNPKAIYINGGPGDDLIVDSTSILEIYANSPQLGIYLNQGTTAGIYGSVIFRGQQAIYIDAENSNAIKFHAGSTLTQNCPGYVFTNSGTINAVVFENGSNLIIQNALSSSPFGSNPSSSKVIFNPNINFILQSSNNSVLSLKGRTYGNFILDMNSSVQVNESFTANTIFNCITIKDGTILNITNTNSNFTPEFYINGNLNVIGSLTFTNNLDINFSGTSLQTITGSGTITFPFSLTSIKFNNSTGVDLERNLTASCPVLIDGSFTIVNSVLAANTTVDLNANFNVNNGYVFGNLTKYFSGDVKSRTFEVGTENGYTPVTINFDKISQSGNLSVKPTASTHYYFEDSTIAMKKYWTINNNNILFGTYSVQINYLSNDFNINFIESRDAANMVVKYFYNGGPKSYNPNISLRNIDSSKIGVNTMKEFGDFTMMKNPQDKSGMNILGADFKKNKSKTEVFKTTVSISSNNTKKVDNGSKQQDTTPRVKTVKPGMGDLKENEYIQGEYSKKGMGDLKEIEYSEGEYKSAEKKGMGDLKLNEYNQDNQSVRNGMGDLKEMERTSKSDELTARSNSTPNEFSISQNYPNPFNPSTKINYDLPSASKVEIKVYDIEGKEISTLVNSTQEAGHYNISFNAQNIVSGVYFYKIIASASQNIFTKTLKMILMK